MDRKGSCATLLRLPLPQNNKRKIADVDENASDGYDQPDRLVIDTSNNCSENMPANDWSEHWMKTVSGRKGDQQEQLCRIDLGNQGKEIVLYLQLNNTISFLAPDWLKTKGSGRGKCICFFFLRI